MIDTTQLAHPSDVRSYFLTMLGTHSSDKKMSVMVQHFGEFSQDLISSIVSNVEEQMIHAGDQKKVIKSVFSILIEGLQNIHTHGERDEHGKQQAFLFLEKNSMDYKIALGNMIRQEDVPIIENYLRKLNELNSEQLKELYNSILINDILSKKEGLGIGFLTMRIKSENKLNHQMLSISDTKMFFSVEVIIPRA